MTGTDLDGRVAIVTGAGRGLGRAEALELARAGARVVVNDYGASLTGDREDSPAKDVVEEIRALGGEAVAHLGDVADSEHADDLIQTAIGTFGQLDVLVNNAGILRDKMIFSMSDDDFDAVIRVHLRGHFATMRAATQHWRAVSKETGAATYARIINTTSEAFLLGSPGQPNYAAAKAGIVALTTSTAHSCARYGVRANVIAPRAKTRMTEGVFGEAEDGGLDPLAPEHVAPLVRYLASPASERVNGQVFVAYGTFIGHIGGPPMVQRHDAPDGLWTADAIASSMADSFAGDRMRPGFIATDLIGIEPV